MSQHMDQVVDAADKEATAGAAAATLINGIAAMVENAGTDEAKLRTAVREIRREAGTLREIVERKMAEAAAPK